VLFIISKSLPNGSSLPNRRIQRDLADSSIAI
jgi:hypothetical protein